MTAPSLTTLPLAGSRAAGEDADALVIALAPGEDGPVPLSPGAELAPDVRRALRALGATGRADEVSRLALPGEGDPAVLVAVGLGPIPDAGPGGEALRRAAGAAVRELAGNRRVVLALPVASTEALRAVAEGALLGGYTFPEYRSEGPERSPVVEVVVVVPEQGLDPVAADRVLRRAEVVCRAVTLARDLVNTPPSDLPPARLAEIASAEASAAGVTAEVFEEAALRDGGYGGILGVGQGSANPPRLVHLSYRCPGARARVALVGKGITFDSGGLSLKQPTAMEEMKCDMAGAAAALAAVRAVAELALAVDLEAWLPMAENLPSGSAIRPSDVLTMRGGRRVEVTNTDAEGRLILADALGRAGEDGPDVLLDAATLTGAQVVALGARTTAVMGNDEGLRNQVVEAAERAGEPSWPMPLPEELRKGLDSEVADLVNTGPREGGMLTAGLFLREFVPSGVRWVHLDVAGPAYNSGPAYGYTPHGGTGAAVRTFVTLVEELAAGPTTPASGAGSR